MKRTKSIRLQDHLERTARGTALALLRTSRRHQRLPTTTRPRHIRLIPRPLLQRLINPLQPPPTPQHHRSIDQSARTAPQTQRNPRHQPDPPQRPHLLIAQHRFRRHRRDCEHEVQRPENRLADLQPEVRPRMQRACEPKGGFEGWEEEVQECEGEVGYPCAVREVVSWAWKAREEWSGLRRSMWFLLLTLQLEYEEPEASERVDCEEHLQRPERDEDPGRPRVARVPGHCAVRAVGLGGRRRDARRLKARQSWWCGQQWQLQVLQARPSTIVYALYPC